MPSYTFTRTLEQVRELVLRRLQILADGETPTGGDAEIVDEAINMRLKELHALGVLWWRVAGAATDLTLTASVATKSLSAVSNFLYPISMALRIGADDRDIEIISHREYQAIGDKSSRGEPAKVFVSGGVAYFWPVPSSDFTVAMTYESVAADTEAGAPTEIPVPMLRPFVTLVASDLIDDFGIPEARAGRLLAQSAEAEKLIRTLNTERVGATAVGVDYF